MKIFKNLKLIVILMIIVIVDDPDYQIGDFDLAVENTEKNSIMDLDENQQRIKYPMSVDSKELGKFGVGL
jgi:hypothetical protein